MSHSEDLTVRARILLMMPEAELRKLAAEVEEWHFAPTKPETALDRHQLIEWLMLHWRSVELGVFAYLERARDNFFKYEGAFADEEDRRSYYEFVEASDRARYAAFMRKEYPALAEAIGRAPAVGAISPGRSRQRLS